MKKIKYILLSLLLLAFITTKAEANTPSSIFTQNLSYGSAGADVTALQNFLISKGYDLSGYTSGTFDWETQTEVAKYQATKGISSTGNFGPLTRAAVIADVGAAGIPSPASQGGSATVVSNSNATSISAVFTQNLAYGSNGQEVTSLQNFLISKGYNLTGYTSGDFGYETQSELAKYQATKGISSTGNFGPLTRAAVIADVGTSVIPTPGNNTSGTNSNQTAIFTQNLSFGSTGAQVTLLQNFLISKGYDLAGYVSGTYDYRTQSALAQYQATKGISTTGNFGPLTRAAVIADVGGGTISAPATSTQGTGSTNNSSNSSNSSTATSLFTTNLSYGSTGNDVIVLQKFLLSKGYSLIGYSTGSYDYPTQRDLARYQATKGIAATGNLGPLTRAAILADGGASITVDLSSASSNSTTYTNYTAGTNTNTTTGTTASGSNTVFNRDLSWGSTGADVAALQNFLVSKGYNLGGYTAGVFEDETTGALGMYQGTKGISTTGSFGPLTRAAVIKDMGTTNISSSNSQNSNVNNTANNTTNSIQTGTASLVATKHGSGMQKSHDVFVNVGDTIDYEWSSTWGSNYTVTFTSTNCGVKNPTQWVDLINIGSNGAKTGATIKASQALCVYTLTYNTGVASDVLTVRVNDFQNRATTNATN